MSNKPSPAVDPIEPWDPSPLQSAVMPPRPAQDSVGPVEVVEVAESENPAPDDTEDSATSTSSAYLIPMSPVWPRDSIIETFMGYARDFTESEDCIIVAALLPVLARLLARRVFIRFGGRKYTNLYNMLVTPPGFRKSTTIRLAARLCRLLLPADALLGGAASEQALFKSYEANCDRLFLEDEGNTVIANWQADAAGKQVAKRFLKLYDCAEWQQNYIRQADTNNGEPLQRIDATSTSLLIGTTFNNCRFNGLETQDGMRRRVNYYVSEKIARTIYWPADHRGFDEVVDACRPLLTLEGVFHPLAGESLNLWKELQDSNRAQIRDIGGVDAASEAYSSALAEEASKILKFAMIFEISRWAMDRSRDWQVIRPDTLQLAAEHGRYCLQASQRLDRIGGRAEIRHEADAVLATVRVEFEHLAKGGKISLSKSDLTHRFAANPSRRGAMTPTRLYGEVLADLQQRKLVRLVRSGGKLQTYEFVAEA